MIIKQLWSKCRLCIVLDKRVKIDIQLFTELKALAILIKTLKFFFGFLRLFEADFKKNCFVYHYSTEQKRSYNILEIEGVQLYFYSRL